MLPYFDILLSVGVGGLERIFFSKAMQSKILGHNEEGVRANLRNICSGFSDSIPFKKNELYYKCKI
jgi:hypothetical protein